MIIMMRGVIDGGTAGRVRRWFGIKADVAGKTGTTNLNADGWFMGCTPRLVSGVWTGGEERSIQFTNGYYGQGSEMALPVWGLYMRKVFGDKSLGYDENEKFSAPAGVNMDELMRTEDALNGTPQEDSGINEFSESTDEF